jgi:hypothetical protein
MPTDPVPTSSFGKVVGRFIHVIGDTAADPDNLPDITPAVGTVTFRPEASHIIVGTPGTAVIPRPVTVNLDSEGYILDTAGQRGLWLLAGYYSLTFQFQGSTFPGFQINVTTDHTVENPLDLALAAPLPTDPAVKWVVNEQVYLDTVAARDSAIAVKNEVDGAIVVLEEAISSAEAVGIEKGVPGGVATLDSSGKVPETQIPDRLSAASLTSAISTEVNTLAGDVTALTTTVNGKAEDSSVVHVTGAETVAGIKTFTDAPVVPDSSFTVAKTSGLQGALDSKAPTSHTHAQADVTGLETALSGKASSTHTHSQAEVTGLETALSGKAPLAHTHAQADVTGLSTALAGKASATHSHAQSDVTGLVAALDGKAPVSHTHETSQVSGLDAALADKASLAHTHEIADVTGLETELGSKVNIYKTVTDWNYATDPGFYSSLPDALNVPASGSTYGWMGTIWATYVADLDVYLVQQELSSGSGIGTNYRRWGASSSGGTVTEFQPWMTLQQGRLIELAFGGRLSPTRLGNGGLDTTSPETSDVILDCNGVTGSGWYRGTATSLNAPVTEAFTLEVRSSDNVTFQTATMDSGAVYTRRSNAGWTPWICQYMPRRAATNTFMNGVTVGNGELIVEEWVSGAILHTALRFTLGTTSAITADIQVHTNWGGALTEQALHAGAGRLRDTSASTGGYYDATVMIANNRAYIRPRIQTSAYVRQATANATTPFTWEAGDIIEATWSLPLS